ncbi:MAG: hypothetical protein EXR62_13095 [Chloroflexi bacterium]|nr:hypothetical protein [Chloroflexota bacterium]
MNGSQLFSGRFLRVLALTAVGLTLTAQVARAAGPVATPSQVPQYINIVAEAFVDLVGSGGPNIPGCNGYFDSGDFIGQTTYSLQDLTVIVRQGSTGQELGRQTGTASGQPLVMNFNLATQGVVVVELAGMPLGMQLCPNAAPSYRIEANQTATGFAKVRFNFYPTAPASMPTASPTPVLIQAVPTGLIVTAPSPQPGETPVPTDTPLATATATVKPSATATPVAPTASATVSPVPPTYTPMPQPSPTPVPVSGPSGLSGETKNQPPPAPREVSPAPTQPVVPAAVVIPSTSAPVQVAPVAPTQPVAKVKEERIAPVIVPTQAPVLIRQERNIVNIVPGNSPLSQAILGAIDVAGGSQGSIDLDTLSNVLGQVIDNRSTERIGVLRQEYEVQTQRERQQGWIYAFLAAILGVFSAGLLRDLSGRLRLGSRLLAFMPGRPLPGLLTRRACNNCRYFQAAGLRGQGWCRNPALYPDQVRHLVRGDDLDCARTHVPDLWAHHEAGDSGQIAR